jgi:adenylate cyclase
VKRLTLSGFFALAIAAVALAVALSMALLLARARRLVLEEADKLQLAASRRIEDAVAAELDRATNAVGDLERGITTGVISIAEPLRLEAPLLVRLLADSHLEELTFTRATLTDYTADGEAMLLPHNRFQVSVRRSPDLTLSTHVVTPEPLTAAPPPPGSGSGSASGSGSGSASGSASDSGSDSGSGSASDSGSDSASAPRPPPPPPAAFAAASRHHTLSGAFPSSPLVAAGTTPDPTTDFTFSVAASLRFRSLPVWSDLHYSEADRALPPEERRIVLTLQQSIFAPMRPPGLPSSSVVLDEGELLGVLRAGLLTRDLDAIAQLRPDPASADPQRVAILSRGPSGDFRLVTRTAPADRLTSQDGELRVAPAALPPELAAFLTSPQSAALAARLDAGEPRASSVLDVDGTPWRVSVARLPNTIGGIQSWTIAVLVVEEHYTRALAATWRGVLWAFAIALAVLVAIGGVALLLVRRDLAQIVAATARMHGFDFSPQPVASAFRDVGDAMAGLERAKTVVRAMGKYIPMDLVRRLYADNAEPALGGEPCDVSILFTDIEGFTTLAERLPVDELALHLGAYLEAMTRAIEATGGTTDKYIGDAVMAVWNAPSPVADHPAAACAAALACEEATTALYASPAWAGLPPLITRFGLHRARVLVGHFGAPTRLSYTALGDGVNLAARLEPLCKQYGVRALVSEDVAAAAPAFRFRRLDRVAVKGKQHGIEVYELVGKRAEPLDAARASRLEIYERALAAYFARDFAAAAALLAPQTEDDPPSAALAARCQRLAAAPPPAQWDGVHVAQSK